MNRIMATLCLVGWAIAPAWAGEAIDERRGMAPDGTVSVSNVAGDIDITAWQRDEVHLTGELGEESELDIHESSSGIRIEVRLPRDGRQGNRRYEASDLELRVPEGASLSVSGVSSDISIEGSRGASISAETVSGDVDVEARTGRLNLVSVSGDISFSGASARSTAETVSGDIDLDGVHGELDVSLVSGDVTVSFNRFSMAKFEAVSGNIEVELEVEAGGRLTVENMSGDARIVLPAGQNAEITAQTFSGELRSQFGSPQKESRGPGRHLRHVAGDGGAEIRVESFSGDVDIGKK